MTRSRKREGDDRTGQHKAHALDTRNPQHRLKEPPRRAIEQQRWHHKHQQQVLRHVSSQQEPSPIFKGWAQGEQQNNTSGDKRDALRTTDGAVTVIGSRRVQGTDQHHIAGDQQENADQDRWRNLPVRPQWAAQQPGVTMQRQENQILWHHWSADLNRPCNLPCMLTRLRRRAARRTSNCQSR